MMLSRAIVLAAFAVCFVHLASHWKHSKLDTLVKAVATPIKSAPVTLVGWQNVLDDKGAVKEVRTIELALEMDNDKKTHLHTSWPMYFGEEDLEENLPYIMDRLHQEKERGINLLGASQTFDTEGKLVEMLMIDDSDIWMNGEEEDVYLMRNMTVKDMDEAKDWAATQNSASLLVFNPDGTFNEKESAVKPELSVEYQWKANKLDVLVDAVADPIRSARVTVVGWQNVLDDKGVVKEVRTIELALALDDDKKGLPISSWPLGVGEEGTDELPYIVDTLNEARESGLNILGGSKMFDTEGKLDYMLMIDDSDIWMNGEDNDVYLMRNMTVKDMDEVKDWAATQKSASLIVFNPDGTFNEKESAVMPELSAYITDQTDATQEMMEDAIKAVSDGYLMHRENLAKYVIERMDKEFPKYSWIVVSGQDGSYTNRDVHIGVEYYTVGLHDYPISLDIFGVKK